MSRGPSLQYLREKVTQFLQEYGKPASIKEIATGTGVPIKQIYNVVPRMKKHDEIVNFSRGVYTLPIIAALIEIPTKEDSKKERPDEDGIDELYDEE